MNLAESSADKAKCQLIGRLPYKSSPADLSDWQNAANTLAFTYERILQQPSASFWSSVVYNKTIMESFDAVLEAIPRRFEIDEYRLIFCWDASAAMAASRLYNSALALFLRVAVHNKKLDPTLLPKQYLEFVRDRGVMNSRRLASAISFFSKNGQIMVEIVKKRALVDPSFSRDVQKICGELEKMFPSLERDMTDLVDKFHFQEGVAKVKAAQLIDEWLCTTLALCQEGNTLMDVLSQAGLVKDAIKTVSGIPALVESVGKLFTTEMIMDVAMTLNDYPLRRLLRLRTQVQQSAVDLYHAVLIRTQKDQKIAIVMSILELERFIYLLNEKQNLIELVEGCQREQKDYIERALEAICESQRAEVVKELDKCGLLTGLGDVTRLDDAGRQAMEEMSQIFPNLSAQYIHLCLRHFGYDATKAIDALLARDSSLPLALRRVEAADLTPKLSSPPTLPAFSFENEELLMSTILRPQQSASQPKLATSQGSKEPEGKNVFRGLISLAPVVPPPTAKTEAAEKPVSDVMKKLREALESLKLRASSIENAFEPQFGVNGERLVPMPTAKKYAGIKKPKISETDKIAIRPSYEKYRYETTADDDVYDDEYDDGYEQREFKVEPLNAQSTSEESGEEESEGTDSASAPPQQSRPTRGGRGGVTTYRRGGGAGTQKSGTGESSTVTTTNETPRSGYTGGRQRQMKERHKNAFKQRGADRKMRGAY
ncbi:unnamed protein product [Cylicocyclus nassatus]|uniref:CUE domain-containing protein n=1 Tax=Cylicocyclus nassatus TaxID=53992 RepID=A0AA36GWP8_CYLNA|nr:unnamed protein product [Cylicocyclus nassatus]